jgi:hypothetical protein
MDLLAFNMIQLELSPASILLISALILFNRQLAVFVVKKSIERDSR